MRFLIFLSALLLLVSCKEQTSKGAPAWFPGWALVPFHKTDAVNPVLQPDSMLVFTDPILKTEIKWAQKDVFNPATVVRNDTLFLLIRAQDKTGKPDGTSRIGLAYSLDGYHFTIAPQPVLFPDNDSLQSLEWQGGCEDPRIVEDGQGTYYMTYTSFDGKVARLLVAVSRDLYHWTKKGPAFAQAYNGKYRDFWSKSGSIVSVYENGKVVATKIKGKYWMYWGDQNIWAATSTDLLNWEPVLKTPSDAADDNPRNLALKAPELKTVFGPRRKKFDSDLVESGPPAMLTSSGILLLYNSRNIPAIGDTSLPEGTYTAAQILLDKNDPLKVVDRMEHFFIQPERPYEKTGQVNNVCFIEGLANYKGKWLLYYGTADSRIAVAEK